MMRLVQELVPLVAETFGTSSDPARLAFGGGSFAGEDAGCGAGVGPDGSGVPWQVGAAVAWLTGVLCLGLLQV